jgi:hypothetical protein
MTGSRCAEYEEGVAQELGSFDQIQLGIDASEATYPIVQTYWTTFYDLKQFLLNGSLINVTVTDQGTFKSMENEMKVSYFLLAALECRS